MHKVYLFTGITSQLGQALCRYIFSVSPDSYIIGTTRSLSSNVALNLQKKYKNLILTLVNPEDKPCIQRLVSLYRPDVIGNLLAQSSVGKSFLYPRETYAVNTLCNINLLESMRICSELSRATDIYRPIYFNISSAEIYGGDSISKEEKTEESPFAPSNLYGLSKASAHSAVDLYRKLYNLKCFNFVCTNFISEFQNENFVVSKILNYLVTIKQQKDKLQLGNISSVRDWMYVDDVCKAIFTCINNPSHESIGNYNISSYEEHSVLDILKKSFLFENIKNYENYINIDFSNFRIIDTSFCRINSEKIRKYGWKPSHDIDSILKKIIKAKKCNKT